MTLTRSVFRHVFRRPSRWLGIVALVTTAVAVFAGTRLGLDRVGDSADLLYDELELFDWHLEIAARNRAGIPTVAELRQQVPGLAAAEWRLDTRGVLTLPDGKATSAAVITASPLQRPTVGDVRITSGQWLQAGRPNGILVDQSWALDHAVTVGDALQLRVASWTLDVEVQGIVVHPEFLMSSVDDHFTMPVRGSVAAVLLSEELMHRRLFGNVYVNSLVMRAEPGAAPAEVATALVTVLEERGLPVRAETPRAEQYSVLCTAARLRSFGDALPTMIALLDGLAAVVLVLTMHRLVGEWRRTAGTLLAFGLGRGRIIPAWIAATASLVALGTALGWLAALGIGRMVAGGFLDDTGFPLLVAPWSPEPLLQAGAISLLLIPLGVIPVLLALRASPRALLLPLVSLRSAHAHATRRGLLAVLPAAERLGLLSVVRRPGVALVSILAIAGTMVMAASMYLFAEAHDGNVHRFVTARRWDAVVVMRQRSTPAELALRLSEAGASSVEALVLAPGRVVPASGDPFTCSLVGLPVPSTLQGEEWLVRGRGLSSPDAPEILLGFRQTHPLGLELGDQVRVEVGDRQASLELVGIVNGFAIDRAWVGEGRLNALVGDEGDARTAMVTAPDDVLDRLLGEADVVGLIPGQRLDAAVLDNLAGFIQIVVLYGHLAATTGLVVLAGLLHTALRDRRTDVAALRAQGVGWPFLARVILTESLLLALLGGLLAVPLAQLALEVFQARLADAGTWVPIPRDLGSVALRLLPPVLLAGVAAVPWLTWRAWADNLPEALARRG